jgi:hypothetical protein
MGVGQALIFIGVLVAALVLAAVLPRRLSPWWAGAILLPGALMLTHGVGMYLETSGPQAMLAVAFHCPVPCIWVVSSPTTRVTDWLRLICSTLFP